MRMFSKNVLCKLMLITLSVVLFSCNAKTARKAEEFAKKTYEEYKVTREKNPGIRYKEEELKNKLSETWNKKEEKRYVRKICGQCGGGGVCYQLDSYGNIMTDIYGNPLLFQCPVCLGSGSVVVEE